VDAGVPQVIQPIGGLTLGEVLTNHDGEWRVVAIDPDTNTVGAEDSTGDLVLDSIDHFITTHCRQ
jgi:hypothetical protein